LGKHPENRKEKAQFLGEAACKLLELKLGWITPDDKDHYGNKVIKFAGQMLADLFRTAFRNLVRDMKYQLERSGQKRGINAVAAAIRPGRTNYLSTISHLRRIQSPLSRTQPNFEARDLHATHFGRICPSETPEGSNCGLVKNLALSGIISVNVPSEEIVEKLYDLGTVHFFDAKEDLKKDGTRIFVDGRLIGYYDITKMVEN
jgi:DNA-directed RNA polymerase subunit B